MELEFAQLDAKIRELQKKEDVPAGPVVLPSLSQPSGVPGLPEKKESTRIVVMAVRGINENLIATLRTREGTHVVKTGDTFPVSEKCSQLRGIASSSTVRQYPGCNHGYLRSFHSSSPF